MANDELETMDAPRTIPLTTLAVIQQRRPDKTRDQILGAIRNLDMAPLARAGGLFVWSEEQVNEIFAELDRMAERRKGGAA